MCRTGCEPAFYLCFGDLCFDLVWTEWLVFELAFRSGVDRVTCVWTCISIWCGPSDLYMNLRFDLVWIEWLVFKLAFRPGVDRVICIWTCVSTWCGPTDLYELEFRPRVDRVTKLDVSPEVHYVEHWRNSSPDAYADSHFKHWCDSSLVASTDVSSGPKLVVFLAGDEIWPID